MSESHGYQSQQQASNRTTRILRHRYLGVLIGVAVLVVLHQVVIQPALVQLGFDAPVINIAGRQRMLSQRLSKAALTLRLVEGNRSRQKRAAELSRVLDEWSAAHHGLLHGDEQLGLPGTTSPAILQAFHQLQPHYEAMLSAGQRLVDAAQNSPADTAVIEQCVQTVLAHEAGYLAVMDRTVGLFESEAEHRVGRLRATGLAVMGAILLLLVAVGLFVLRPATELIASQIASLTEGEAALLAARDRLEERVQERTRQLTGANAALEREIDERRRIEERSRTLHEQLAHASRVTAVGQLATGLAHELNQPLGAIANYAEVADLLLEAETINRQRATTAVHSIRAAAHRAGDIIRRMRNFVRGRRSERQETDLNSLVREVIEFCGPETRRAAVDVRLDLTRLPTVNVDAIQIQQVLVNLIQNALHSLSRIPPRQRKIEIHIGQTDSNIRISVADSGLGFDGDPAELFDEFRTTSESGLGLGLSISRSIVHEHAGSMSAGRGPLGGAVVSFTIPVQGSETTHPDAECAEDDSGREVYEVSHEPE